MCNYQNQSFQTFPVKGQIANILGFAGHIVSVATTKLWCVTVWKLPQNILSIGSVAVFQWNIIYKNSLRWIWPKALVCRAVIKG